MKYFGPTFWKMSLGFLVLILIGLGGVYLINHFDKNAQSGILDTKPETVGSSPVGERKSCRGSTSGYLPFFIFKKFMAISKNKKKDILDKLTEVVKAKALVFVNFRGLPVSTGNELRRSLASQGSKYLVVKKTLLKRAVGAASIAGDLPDLPGETAVAYGDDALASAKGVYEFEKKTLGQVKIVGGVYEGAYADAVLMTSLAQIPSREVLLGQFVNIINSPIAGLVMALDAIAKKQEA